MNGTRWLGYAGLAAAGALTPLAFAPFGWWPVAVASLAALFVATKSVTPRIAAIQGWFFGAGMFGAGVSWIHESFQYNNVHGPIVWVLTAGFIVFLAVFPAAACWLGARFGAPGSVARSALAMPAAWLLLEWVRGWLLTGFTWLQLGYSQVDGPGAAWIPLTGSYGAGLLVALASGAACALVCIRARASLLVAAAVLSAWVGAAGLKSLRFAEPDGDALKVALVQGNYAQDIKWLARNLEPTLESYRRHSLQAIAAGAEIVIWPETAVPALRNRVAPYLRALDRAAEDAGASILLGIPERSGPVFRNSVVAVGLADGVYQKRHLVPFGEYVPFATLLRPLLKWMGVPAPRFAPGDASQTVSAHRHVRFGITICYESAFGSEVSTALPRANVLVNVSNDAWFGDTLAPHQHLQIARVRALETARPLLRATNTGITALIDHHGKVRSASAQFAVAVLEGEVQPMTGMTWFARFGDWPAVLLAAVLLAVAGVRQRQVQAAS